MSQQKAYNQSVYNIEIHPWDNNKKILELVKSESAFHYVRGYITFIRR